MPPSKNNIHPRFNAPAIQRIRKASNIITLIILIKMYSYVINQQQIKFYRIRNVTIFSESMGVCLPPGKLGNKQSNKRLW